VYFSGHPSLEYSNSTSRLFVRGFDYIITLTEELSSDLSGCMSLNHQWSSRASGYAALQHDWLNHDEFLKAAYISEEVFAFCYTVMRTQLGNRGSISNLSPSENCENGVQKKGCSPLCRNRRSTSSSPPRQRGVPTPQPNGLKMLLSKQR
jgi:hypothetical protein